MSSSSTDTFDKTVSTTVIIIAVVSVVVGIIFCIGSVVIIICIIKQCNRPRGPITNGMILQPYPPPYPTQYQPQYPPRYPPPYPPYSSSEPEFTKPTSI